MRPKPTESPRTCDACGAPLAVCPMCGRLFPADAWKAVHEPWRCCSRRCAYDQIVARRHARTLAQLEAKFWARVDRSGGPDACWLWLGARLPKGYGVLSVNGVHSSAHRFAFTYAHGAIPEGLWVLHRCDTPECVNPAHLYAGSPRQNSADMVARGRATKVGRPGEENPAAKITDADVRMIRARYAAGGTTLAALGREYGLSQTNVSAIIRRKHWQHVP